VTSYRIPNSYQTPIGSALGNLMTAFASMPSPEDRAYKAAQLENVQSQAALNRQKLVDSQGEAQRAAAYGGNIAGVINKIFSPPPEQPRATPDSVGPMPAVPADEHVRSNLGALAGAVDPKQVGQLPELFLSMFANAPGTTQGTVERSQIGAGKPYASTQTAVDAERERKYQADMDRNIRAEKAANYAAARQAETQDRIDARQGKQVIGADGNAYWFAPGMPYHGQQAPFAAQSGPSNQAAAKLDAASALLKTFNDLETTADANPQAMGAAGSIATGLRGVGAQANSIAGIFGQDLAPVVAPLIAEATKRGFNMPQTADAAAQLQSLSSIVPAMTARALGETTGQSSRADESRYAAAFGTGPLSNAADLKARLAQLRRVFQHDIEVWQARAGNKAPAGIGNAVTNTFSPAPAAPAAAVAPGTSDPLGIRR